MYFDSILDYSVEALLLTLIISAPPVIAATAIGLLISILQALTQIQDQTIPFAGKLLGIGICTYLLIEWNGQQMYQYTESIFETLHTSKTR